jgi:hypothetical protein
MSHCFGAMCAQHRIVMSPDTCPERGCPGNHGYAEAECDARCPLYQAASKPLLPVAWNLMTTATSIKSVNAFHGSH